MSEYVLREIEQVLSRPTRAEVFARIAELPPIELDPRPPKCFGKNGIAPSPEAALEDPVP